MNRLLAIALIICLTAAAARAEDAMQALLATYKTAPQGYPTGKDERGIPYAQPDTEAHFRWHFYNDDAIPRFEDAKMLTHSDPYHLMEEARGVTLDKGCPIRFSFVAENVFEGAKALKLEAPGDAIKSGNARIHVAGISGAPSHSKYFEGSGVTCAAAYWSKYRWLRADAFNPGDKDIRVLLAGVPVRIPPGKSTIAVKTADATGHGLWDGLRGSICLEFRGPAADTTLYIDNVRMEQEVPETISKHGVMLQFPGRYDPARAPFTMPGFTPIEVGSMYEASKKAGWTQAATKRYYGLHIGDMNLQNPLLLGWCSNVDSPLRIDVPDGRYGVWLCAAPSKFGYNPLEDLTKGRTIKINGADAMIIKPRTPQEIRRMALGGEAWDYRPGACIWEELVRPAYYPPTDVVYAQAKDGHLLLEIPPNVALGGIIVFPEQHKEAALKELGRLNYLFAESWEVAHPWVKADAALRGGYIGTHEEALRPESIPERLAALKLDDADFKRGFRLFQRGLTEAVYSDTIPTAEEAAARELKCAAVPGERECMTLGVLPLVQTRGVRVSVSALKSAAAEIPPSALELRWSRQHHKTTSFGHANGDYTYQEHYLVKREQVDLHPAAARRLYVDVSVPQNIAPGVYSGTLTFTSAENKVLATVPLSVEVLGITLKQPHTIFAGTISHPKLKDYGINTVVGASYDDAAKHGFSGFACWAYDASPPLIGGKRLGLSGIAGAREHLKPLIAKSKEGKAPRLFVGGPAPVKHDAKHAENAAAFFRDMLSALPELEVLGVNIPIFCSPWGYRDAPHEWACFQASAPIAGTTEALNDAAKSGKPFWFIDGLRQSQEQPARFTYGFWLWRSGAAGRCTTLESYYVRLGMHGTAADTYPYTPYYTVVGYCWSNNDVALMESLTEGEVNPSRDLLLIREGIDDYRYIYTLDALIRELESSAKGNPGWQAAKSFRDALHAEVSLDLKSYYTHRWGSYSENWYTLPGNPWNGGKFDATRRACAAHILALQKLGK
ncbi:MAG TPA: hypothetical protein VEJ63_16070 [Planctomycetota bacterium]|nr:hypothetical protein [Planctomycetota bacterium]